MLFIVWSQLTPTVSHVQYRMNDGATLSGELPLSFSSRDPAVALTVIFHIEGAAYFRPSLYTIRADDCLSRLVVNGRTVTEALYFPCDIDRFKDLRLGGLIGAGDNTIVATIPDTGGRQGFSIEVSKRDPLLLAVRILMVLVALFFGALLASRCRDKTRRVFFLLIILGVLLRLVYFDVTSFNVRGNDAEGHLEYIAEVVKHWHVPAIHGGWEFYQPPLYYFVAAVPYVVFQSLGLPMALVQRLIQGLGVLCSLGILGICAWMAHRLFSDKQKLERLLWVATFAVFPGLLLLTPKINNDVLVQFLSFAAAALTIQFWQTGRSQAWYGLVVTVALGMLTKTNVAPVIAVAFLSLALHQGLDWRRKLTLGCIGALILLALTEWLFVWRFVEDPQAGIVGNIGNLNGGLLVTNRLRDYITFHPYEMLQHPFNNPWDDTARRGLFFEYFFRSALFGEYNGGLILRQIAQVVLGSSLACGVLAIVGMMSARGQEWKRVLPFWILFAFVLVTHIVFRFKYPYAPSQDFRYSAVILLPVTYFLLLVPGKLSTPLRQCAYALIITTLIAYTFYALAVSIVNPL